MIRNPFFGGERGAGVAYYGLTRFQAVQRSVIATEVYTLVHACDNGYFIRDAIHEYLGRHNKLEDSLSSVTLFNVDTKKRKNVELTLQIDICARRES